MTLEQLEAEVLRFGSRLTALDAIIAAEKLGRPKTLAFRCSHSGLFWPPDYCKEWGRKYGIGLGPEPCSETLNTIYEGGSLAEAPRIRTEDQLMFPVGTTMAQIDLAVVPVEEFDAMSLIPHEEDPDFEERVAIILKKQMEKSPELRDRVFNFRAKKGVR